MESQRGLTVWIHFFPIKLKAKGSILNKGIFRLSCKPKGRSISKIGTWPCVSRIVPSRATHAEPDDRRHRPLDTLPSPSLLPKPAIGSLCVDKDSGDAVTSPFLLLLPPPPSNPNPRLSEMSRLL